MLREALLVMLDVQELDIQMIRLMRLKRDRVTELERIRGLRNDLHHQVVVKENDIVELKKVVRLLESEVTELSDRVKKLETQQSSIRKVEEFNALTHEISSLEREKAGKEQKLSDLYDKVNAEEDFLKDLITSFGASKIDSEQLESEIKASVLEINEEGRQIMDKRERVAAGADKEVIGIYEKLLHNKKDRVIVPIEDRCCSGCHITVTAQHENIVKKGDRLVFCEHCSRIHYWHEAMASSSEVVVKKRRKATEVVE